MFVLLSAEEILKQVAHITSTALAHGKTSSLGARAQAPRSPRHPWRRCSAQRLQGRVRRRKPERSQDPVSPHMQHPSRPRGVARCHRQQGGYLLCLWAKPPERLRDRWERLACVGPHLVLFSHRSAGCHLLCTGSIPLRYGRTHTDVNPMCAKLSRKVPDL